MHALYVVLSSSPLCLFTGANELKVKNGASGASIAMSAGSDTTIQRPSVPLFHVNAVTGAVIGTRTSSPGDSHHQAPIAPQESRKGPLSWLGC